MKVENIYINNDDIITYDSDDKDALQVINMLYDIAAGICNSQKLDSAMMPNSKFNMSKIKHYQPRTKIPEIIQNALNNSNYRKDYEWQHDTEFISDGIHFKVIKYDITTSDWCLVLMDGREKKMTKKSLREWWEDRDI